ncbi:MAG: undecaprenyl-phosphate glucose phosphotransferase [Lentisphaerae bacterium]|nr:undecaprenyl-phosphate glucose phosphotransferase [Lentisphaerota bacterium]
MRRKDTSDVLASAAAVAADAAAVLGGFALATWLRFDSGLLAVPKGRPPDLYAMYLAGAGAATLLFLFVFRGVGLYVRPQTGSFVNKIPRIIRACFLSVVLTTVLAFSVQNEAEFSRGAIALAFFTVCFLVLLERYALYRVEWNLARHSRATNRVLILGTDTLAAHVKRVLSREPMLRSEVIGFMRTDVAAADPDVPAEQIRGSIGDLTAFTAANAVDQVILTDPRLDHDRVVEIILLCEKRLITFNMVPDLFRVMTRSMDVQSLEDIPLLGVAAWPLDLFWNRALKRVEDVAGAVFGLIVAAPAIAAAAVAVKRGSPGPVFYRQERCGERGRPFTIYKLRTMRADAESESGPVFASKDDRRRTKAGAFLRRHNIDELPQLWNVLKGEMSLVGPRPERPFFVEQFKDHIAQYMWRHVSKPGMTGWAQVNGLRGDTSIEERIKYDLFYLENWSLAMDFKILARTVFARKNAY